MFLYFCKYTFIISDLSCKTVHANMQTHYFKSKKYLIFNIKCPMKLYIKIHTCAASLQFGVIDGLRSLKRSKIRDWRKKATTLSL